MKNLLKSIVVSILTFEAKLLLRRTKPKIIAVTGNVGKTSTKDAIYHVLRDSVSARKSEKSYNSEIGVPLSILGLHNGWNNPLLWLKIIFSGLWQALLPYHYPKVLVLEMGVDRPGDMKKLTAWIKPDIVVLTRLPEVPVHVEYFSSPEEVIKEKLILLNALKDDGVLIYNNDDERVHQAAEETRQKSFSYGRYAPADFTADADEIVYEGSSPTGIQFTVKHHDDSGIFSVRGVVGMVNIYSITAAAAVANCFDIGLEAAAEKLGNFVPPPGRMRLINGLKDTLIIDDTYNSSPTALDRALSTLKELSCSGRKIAVVGDMLELGRFSITAHEQAGVQAAECSDILITVGMRSRRVAESAQNAGMDEESILQYEEAVRAGRELQNFIEPGDIVLIKGSQGTRMEKIVLDIMNEPERAKELLVRQGRAWQGGV